MSSLSSSKAVVVVTEAVTAVNVVLIAVNAAARMGMRALMWVQHLHRVAVSRVKHASTASLRARCAPHRVARPTPSSTSLTSLILQPIRSGKTRRPRQRPPAVARACRASSSPSARSRPCWVVRARRVVKSHWWPNPAARPRREGWPRQGFAVQRDQRAARSGSGRCLLAAVGHGHGDAVDGSQPLLTPHRRRGAVFALEGLAECRLG